MPDPSLDNGSNDLEALVEDARQERDGERRDDLVWKIAQHDRSKRLGVVKQLMASDDRDAQMLGADVVAATPHFESPEDRAWAKEQGLPAADVEPFTSADRDWLARVLSRNLGDSQDPDLVQSWVKAIGTQGLAESTDAVIRHASDDDADVRMASAVALGDLGGRRPPRHVVEVLLLLARDPVDVVRSWALFALGRARGTSVDTPEVRAAFIENATHPDGDVREEAISALALLGDVEMLEEALASCEFDLRLVEAARRTGDPRLHQPLLRLIKKSRLEPTDPETSEHVLKALLGAAEACRPLDGESP